METQITQSIMPFLLMNSATDSLYKRIFATLLMVFLPKFIQAIVVYVRTVIDTRQKAKQPPKTGFQYECTCITTFENGKCGNTFKPMEFNAINEYIIKTLSKDTNAPMYNVEVTYGLSIVKFIDESTVYNVTDNITLKTISKTVEKDRYTTYTNSIILTHQKNDKASLDAFITHTLKEFSRKDERQCIFVLNDDTLRNWSMIQFNTTKTFDNMFFKQKNDLKERLEFFQNNENEYKRLGIPYTLGIMFHGDPGTGKTSAIKSIANYTGRHLIIVPLKHIKKIDTLKTIMTSSMISNFNVPFEKRIYVFEEIDCSGWADIIRSRKLKDICDNSACSEDNKSKEPEIQVTLGEFLELLDGVVEIPGRIIIMTTNHPEDVDPAIMRPGRIDMKIHFTKMRRQDIADMYKLWFSYEIPKWVFEKLEDGAFSQAELGNIFATRKRDVIHDRLTQ
jgi:hypothetical protein